MSKVSRNYFKTVISCLTRNLYNMIPAFAGMTNKGFEMTSSIVFGNNAVHIAVFKNKHREVLLTKKRNIPVWVLPGGHLEKGESFDEAAVREYKEETGLVIKILSLKSIYTHERKFEKRIYEGKIIGGRMKTSNESTAVGWFNLNKLPKPMTFYEQQRIKSSLHLGSKAIKWPLSVSIGKEVACQLKNPLLFIELLYFFIKDLFIRLITDRNSRSFSEK